ncbi:MAG: hypothetical protein B7C24_00570 [Bacteroidetes bacterium 4572_77]|nr:MAG: hypothetical protein B7C24_00570 [Bacteroidetes bacterium 4572_77]
MNHTKIYSLSLLLLLISFGSFAQKEKEVFISASWSTAVPMGAMTDYVKVATGRGFQIDISQSITENIFYGGNMGWQMFYEEGMAMHTIENVTATALQRNTINAIQLMGFSRFYFVTSATKIKAYLNMEIGATFIANESKFWKYIAQEMEWHFALSPGVGIDIPASENLGINIYMKFPNSFKSNGSDHYMWINTGIGMYFKIPNS